MKGLVVVETERTRYLGTITKTDTHLTVHTGYSGRPPVIPLEDVEEIIPAHRHPDVEVV